MRKLAPNRKSFFTTNKPKRLVQRVLADIRLNFDSPLKQQPKSPKAPPTRLFDSKRLTFAKHSIYFNENRHQNSHSPRQSPNVCKPARPGPRRSLKKPACDVLIRKNIAKNLKSNVFNAGRTLTTDDDSSDAESSFLLASSRSPRKSRQSGIGGLILSRASQKTVQKSGKKRVSTTKEPVTDLLLSEEFPKVRGSTRSVSRKSHFSQKKTHFCRSSTGHKFGSFCKYARTLVSPKKSFNNESRVIRSKSFRTLTRRGFAKMRILGTKSRKIASTIHREKRQRLLVKLRSLALLCRFLDKSPHWVLGSKVHWATRKQNAQTKWFFLSIQKGVESEVRSLVRADRRLLYCRDKVLVTAERQNESAYCCRVHEAEAGPVFAGARSLPRCRGPVRLSAGLLLGQALLAQ